ncbi:MAG: NAD(P)-dependent oxidoreductase [Verrucomicrobiales bacterium]|nr:NAD(P)-dependent oxidoreductase [Verrucomicrobiales bacterium]
MSFTPDAWPATVRTETELDDLLTTPSSRLVASIREYASPLVILGAGGKMGPSLAVLARRAADAAGHPLDVVAVSRFSNPAAREWLERRGVRTVSCDLLNGEAADLRALPDASNLVYLVGLKFGTSKDPATTWASNTLVPARVCERYAGSRMVALSTGNVYPTSEPRRGGSVESDALTPVGEYANAAVGRERVFEYASRRHGVRLAMLRLFYAVELRYGVPVDIATKVRDGEAIRLANGFFTCIWQGDANEAILRALPLAGPEPAAWNLCRSEVYSVREVAAHFGRRLGRDPVFQETESGTALLGNPARLWAELGMPAVDMDRMVPWIADWVRDGGRNLGRPTHFETRDGSY